MDIQTIQPAVAKYIETIRKHIRVKEARVFGSFALHNASDTSDIDLLILSDDFATIDMDERSKLLYRASVGFPYDLHVFGLTPQEFDQASPLTALGQVKNTPTILFH